MKNEKLKIKNGSGALRANLKKAHELHELPRIGFIFLTTDSTDWHRF
jgi:hypothetical protein